MIKNRGPPTVIKTQTTTTQTNKQRTLTVAMIKVTKSDLIKGRTYDCDWYPVEVIDFDEKAAKTDGSTNYVYTFRILSGPFEGGELTRTFSEKVIGMMVPFVEACGGKFDEDGGSFDPAALKGRKLQVYNNNRMYEGKMRNDVSDFRPL